MSELTTIRRRTPRGSGIPRGLAPDAADPEADDSIPASELEATAVSSETASANDGLPAIRPPRRPGINATARDLETTQAVIREQIRREGLEMTAAELEAEVNERFQDLCAEGNRFVPREFHRLLQSSWSPDRRDIRDHVEIKAMRSIPEIGALEEAVGHCRNGRPTQRNLAIAIFMRLAMGDCRPEFRKAFKGFQGSDKELDWAYLDTTDVSEVQALMRDETTVRRVMKGVLERNDPETTTRLNMQAANRIAARHPSAYTYLYVDGTEIDAHLEQTGDVSREHAILLNRGTGASFGHHGGRDRKPKSWRGWKLLVLGSVKLGLGLVAKLIPAREPEYPHVADLLETFFRYADRSLLPAGPIYVVGDSEYDRYTRLAFDLQDRMGVVPVFDLRDRVGRDWNWGETKGVPHCSKHGPMKRVQAENFISREVPLAYERDFEQAKKQNQARIRWLCPECAADGTPVRANTWLRQNARIYTYLPRIGREDDQHAALRIALMARRNGAESIFSALKLRGIGGKAHFKAKWITRAEHMEWLCLTGVLAMCLRREAHETGLYAATAAEARDLGLVKVPLKVPATALSAR